MVTSPSIIKSWKLFFKEYFVTFLQVCSGRFDTGGRKGDKFWHNLFWKYLIKGFHFWQCFCYCFFHFLFKKVDWDDFEIELLGWRKHLPIYKVCERILTSKLNAVPNQPRNDVLSAAEDLPQAQCRQKTQGLSASRHLQYTKFRLQR